MLDKRDFPHTLTKRAMAISRIPMYLNMRFTMKFATLFIAFLVITLNDWSRPSLASDPSVPTVSFDVPAAIACREISMKMEKSQKKLVEAEIPLSAQIGYPADKLQSIRVELATFERLPAIIDFMPKQTLVAGTEGGVEITESEDGRVTYTCKLQANGKLEGKSKGNASASNGIASASAEVAQTVEGSGNAAIGVVNTKGSSLIRTYTLPAPNVVQATSGTLERGAGIWFKLERTAQHHLEKQHKLYIIFEVDKTWRCDAIKVAVQGKATSGEVCGEKAFYMGMYLEGDTEAKIRASNIGLNVKYDSISAGQRKVNEIEGYLSYPLLGYGSMAERERKKVRRLQKEFDDELAGLRLFLAVKEK